MRILLPFTQVLSKFGVAAAVFTVCCIHGAWADNYISPDLIRVKTPDYFNGVDQVRPVLGEYRYSVNWEGIPAALASVSVEERDGQLQVTTTAKTLSGIDLFYKLRYHSLGLLSSFDFSPIKFAVQHQENSKIRNVKVDFREDGTVAAERSQVGSEDVTTLEFKPFNITLDPISAGVLAKSSEWQLGETKTFDSFNGKSRYLIALTAVDKKTIQFNEQSREVWVLTPKVRNLTAVNGPNKLRNAEIFLTTDTREVLKIVSSVFVGSVNVELEEFIPDANSAAIQVAKAPERTVKPRF